MSQQWRLVQKSTWGSQLRLRIKEEESQAWLPLIVSSLSVLMPFSDQEKKKKKTKLSCSIIVD